MKKVFSFTFSLIMGITVYGQNYNDLFTTYKNANTQQNNGVTQYQTIDPNQFYQNIAPQNVQMVNGVFLYQGQFYSIKLKVGISGTDPIKLWCADFGTVSVGMTALLTLQRLALMEYPNKSEWLAHIKSIFHLSAQSFSEKWQTKTVIQKYYLLLSWGLSLR